MKFRDGTLDLREETITSLAQFMTAIDTFRRERLEKIESVRITREQELDLNREVSLFTLPQGTVNRPMIKTLMGYELIVVDSKQDTSPLVKPTRHKQTVRIQEINTPSSPMFDVTAEYPSDELPAWFAPLQAIVEDDTFTNMDINLGDRVRYHISIVNKKEYPLFPGIRTAEDGSIRMRVKLSEGE